MTNLNKIRERDEFNRGLQEAIDEITGWENLHKLNYETLSAENAYKYPKEAEREHGNTMRLLAVIKRKIEKKKQTDELLAKAGE